MFSKEYVFASPILIKDKSKDHCLGVISDIYLCIISDYQNEKPTLKQITNHLFIIYQTYLSSGVTITCFMNLF